MIKLLSHHEGLAWFENDGHLVVVRGDYDGSDGSPKIFIECPMCGSTRIIPPSDAYPVFTCDECGEDFDPDLAKAFEI